MTTRVERLEAAISGELADRPPVALWRHFPVDDQDPKELARSTSAFQQEYDFDFVKVTPSSSYCLKDWGVEDEWRGNAEGTRVYTRRVIEEVADWDSLQVLNPQSGYLGQQLECLRLIRGNLPEDTPVLQTIFSPLAQAKNLAGGDKLMVHLRSDPGRVERALETITRTTVNFVEDALETGIDGIFYAIQHGSYGYFDPDSYTRFGLQYDLRIREAAERSWLNVLHLHGEDLIFDLISQLPMQVINWHDRDTELGLAQVAEIASGAVCGGLRRWKTLVLGNPDQVQQEAQEALQATGGRGMILGAGCVTPVLAPRTNLQATRAAVISYSH